jgi:hypothetical protein
VFEEVLMADSLPLDHRVGDVRNRVVVTPVEIGECGQLGLHGGVQVGFRHRANGHLSHVLCLAVR